jgi:hypothetical protein
MPYRPQHSARQPNLKRPKHWNDDDAAVDAVLTSFCGGITAALRRDLSDRLHVP